MSTKKVIQRNLDLNKEYSFVSAKYISLVDGSGCSCDNCGKLIANIVIIKDAEGSHYNVGSDCATTLQSLQKDYNYFLNKDIFSEGKSLRAKVNKLVKSMNDEKINFRDRVKEIYMKGDSLFFIRNDNSRGFNAIHSEVSKAYIRDLVKEIK